MWSAGSSAKSQALLESAAAREVEIRNILAGKIHPQYAEVLKHALKRLTEHAKRIDHPDQRVGVTLGRYLSTKAIASPAVTNKELDLLSAHIRKVTECLEVIAKDPSVFAAWRFLKQQSARSFWTEKCRSDAAKVKWPAFEKAFKEYYENTETYVLQKALCLSRRHMPEDDHVHLYDFAILTDQLGVFGTYVHLLHPMVLPTKGTREELLRCTYFFDKFTIEDTLMRRDPTFRQFFEIAYYVNKWAAFNGGLLVEFAQEAIDIKALYEDSPRPRLSERLLSFQPADRTVDEATYADKRDNAARTRLLAMLNTCIEEERHQLRHETNPELVAIHQASLLLKEHHKRCIAGASAVPYPNSTSFYKRSDWISGEEISRSFVRAPPLQTDASAPPEPQPPAQTASVPAPLLLKPIQVTESEEVTLVITPKSSRDSPMSQSRREAKRDKKRRDEQRRLEPPREDWDLTQSRTPSKEQEAVKVEAKAEAKPALPPMQESAKSPAVSFAATAAAPSPKAAEPKADAEALSASVRPAAAGEEERKDKKEKKAHTHSKSKKRLQLDASSSSPLPSPKPVATAATESVEHKPALAHQTSKLILAGSEACVQFVCSCCGGQNVVSLASLGLTLPTSGATSPPAPAPAASAALGASLARSASKGVRRLSDFVNTDVIHAQRVVRRWLMRKRWGRLVADVKNHSSSLYARLRNDTLKEIIQSEESYLAHLLLVVRLYVNPLTDLAARANVKRAPLMSRTEIFDVFSNFEVLADFHVELLQELKERALLYPTITHLGDIFVRMAPLMKLYSSYIRMYDVSTALLTDLRKNRPALNTWLNARSDGAECKGQPLESYLIMPVQRLPRYQMLLQQLLKYTSQEHVDFANLTKAIERVKSVLEVINVRAREEQDKHAMQLVRKRLHGALDEDDSRRLLYETTVKWRLRGGKLHKEATLLLFNNLILIVKESKGVMDKLFESNKKPGEQVPADVNLKVKRRLDLHESPVWETPEPNSVEVWTSTHPAEADRLQITFLDNIHCGNVVRVLQAIAASASSVSLVPVSPSPPGAHSSQSPRHSHKKSSATSVDLKKH